MTKLRTNFMWFRQVISARVPFIKGFISPLKYTQDKAQWINSSFPNPLNYPGKRLIEIESALQVFGSDKAHHHDYQYPYSLLLDQIHSGSLIEIGIGSKNKNFKANMGWFSRGKPGGSLRAWNSLDKFDFVIGGDIDEQVLFNEGKIRTYQVDQTDKKSLSQFVNKCSKVSNKISLIIDDGFHDAKANLITFENLYPILQKNGIYVIEDIKPHDLKIIMDQILKNSDIKDWAIWQNYARTPDNVMLILFKI